MDVRALAKRSSLAFRQSRRITAGLHLMQVAATQGESAAAVLARLRADPAVESVGCGSAALSARHAQ